MSAVMNTRLVSAPRTETAQPSTLRPVVTSPARRRRPKLFYASVALAIVLGTIVGQIALSVVSSSNAFEIDELQTANKTITRTYEQVSQEVAQLASPQHLALSAEGLGMVSSTTPAYLRLADATVIGHASRASRSGALLGGSAANLVPNAEMPAVVNSVNSVNASVAVGTVSSGSVALPATAKTIPAPKTR